MRLLLISDAWYPQLNGVVRALSKTCELLEARGHETVVLGPDRFKSVPAPSYPEIRLALCTPWRVGRIIDETEPDAVHIATEGPLGLTARWCLKRRRIPFTTSFHTLFPQYLELRWGIPSRWTFAGLRRFHGGAARTMYNTPSLRKMLESHGFTNLVQWVRGVDTDLFRPIEPAPLDLPRPVQIYVGESPWRRASKISSRRTRLAARFWWAMARNGRSFKKNFLMRFLSASNTAMNWLPTTAPRTFLCSPPAPTRWVW